MIHQNRRKELLSQIDDNAVIVISTNPEQFRNGDVTFPFRPHSDFFYLTGFQEPQAVAVISRSTYTMFLRDKDPDREIWDGERLGLADATGTLKLEKALNINLLEDHLSQLITAENVVYFDEKPCDLDRTLSNLLSSYTLKSLQDPLHEMRLIKDEFEMSTMQRAANISMVAHVLAMQNVSPNMFEYELQSVFDAHFVKNNAVHAYTPIVAGGKNACILHYIENNQPLNDGDLVLIDAGCEFENYASDITRTFPINGRFSTAQKQIYQIVLDAQLAAIESIKPGISVHKPHEIASNIIRLGLESLGLLLPGEPLSNFYMHGTGHWLGMDVHDVGKYQHNQQHRKFEEGMVITVEPGIYIRKDDKINPIYHDIGIRIEDDVLVTNAGNTVLTEQLAKTIDEIETLMSED
ncbi:aminopeptidase P N-terminal domain-containing protein [Candidatus Thioglobus sp.]|nr:aminopeptidase P N-terminal domain-containing protein [Candidatus Thioglobus sp.]MDB3893410.1 aminopeptidase P N-terminal domain-containing protein [Candidatus Thioglobus sp.]MDC0388435.1 aminopeptidase P N-terminal domain-containing protein [Candidatus Thioglobus sp.]MDC0904646.1 aminopeptidase P N-terminal domain-containing protein [Candidatus Thioglobus sp.]MDC0965634.1 aminopeptidase P N-terminal domain-containing protein [Candidatus Thioglobus sp.]